MKLHMKDQLTRALAKMITLKASERGTDPHAVMSRIEAAVARAEAERETRKRVKQVCADAQKAELSETDWVERLRSQINENGGAMSWH